MLEEFSVGLEVSPKASMFFVGDKKTHQYMTAFVMKPWSGSVSGVDPDSAIAWIRIWIQQNVWIWIRIRIQ